MQHFITSYSYAAVFLLMLAESACIPIPSELIMLFGGALAAGAVAGAHPSLLGIIAAGVAGNVAGSYLAWAAGRYWGQAVVRRWGRHVGLREHDIDRAASWFDRYGPAAVGFGRLVPVVRTFISLPAGFARMPPGRFGLYTTAGCVPWTTGLAIAGYALGRNWQGVANDFHGPTLIIAAVIAVALVTAVVLHFRRRPPNGAHASGRRRARAARRLPVPSRLQFVTRACSAADTSPASGLVRSPHRAIAGAATPRRAKNAPSPIQPAAPYVRHSPIITTGAAAAPAPMPSPASPWYCPWACTGAMPKSSANDAAAWLVSPSECTTIAPASSKSAGHAGRCAASPIAEQLSRNMRPARRLRRPGERCVPRQPPADRPRGQEAQCVADDQRAVRVRGADLHRDAAADRAQRDPHVRYRAGGRAEDGRVLASDPADQRALGRLGRVHRQHVHGGDDHEAREVTDEHVAGRRGELHEHRHPEYLPRVAAVGEVADRDPGRQPDQARDGQPEADPANRQVHHPREVEHRRREDQPEAERVREHRQPVHPRRARLRNQ